MRRNGTNTGNNRTKTPINLPIFVLLMRTRTHLALFCILTLLLTFTACKPPISADDISNTTEANTTTVTTEPTKTTTIATEPSDTTPVTTEPSSTATEPDVQDVAKLTDEQCFSFIYNGRQPHPTGPELDLSKLTPGYLYVHNEETNEIYLIGNKEVAQMDTSEPGYIYYRPKDNSGIVRSDYTGETQTVIYTSEKEVTWFDYSADKLLIVENKKKMVLVDLATGTSEVITEQFCINEAFYFPDASDFTSEDKGRTIQWYGKATEMDELNCYIYYIDENEMYIPTWH